MEELFGAFLNLLGPLRDDERILSAVVFAAWRKAAGKQLSERAKPLQFRHKRLTIAVENESWRSNLEELSSDILYRLSTVLGHGIVTFLEFRVDMSAFGAESEAISDLIDKPDAIRELRPRARA